ncbi:MAG: hypothetical protein IOC76_01885 [Rhodobacter sp.]|nr:hypothetical protein [Rhodobacter sp.]MCA3558865.1 hypothetical protein [Rhodobacter sp.]
MREQAGDAARCGALKTAAARRDRAPACARPGRQVSADGQDMGQAGNACYP